MKLKNGKEMMISKAEVQDAKAMIEYLNLVGGESDNLLFGKDEWPMDVEAEEKFIERMTQSERSALLVGKIDGEIAAVGSIDSPNRARLAHQCELALSVQKQFWNIGVGTALMNALIDFARQTRKIEIIHLGVRADNLNAISLYKKWGLKKSAGTKTSSRWMGYTPTNC